MVGEGDDGPRVLREALIDHEHPLILQGAGELVVPGGAEGERVAKRGQPASARPPQRLGQRAPLELQPVAAGEGVEMVVGGLGEEEAEVGLHAMKELVDEQHPPLLGRGARDVLPDERGPAGAAPCHRRIRVAERGGAGSGGGGPVRGDGLGERIRDDHRPAERDAPEAPALAAAELGRFREEFRGARRVEGGRDGRRTGGRSGLHRGSDGGSPRATRGQQAGGNQEQSHGS